MKTFVFDQIDDNQHPNDVVIGCSIVEKSLCINCGRSGKCKYEGAKRCEVD